MSDQKIRNLERQAVQGDPEAASALKRELGRLGMSVEELRAWLEQHTDAIAQFMDYETTLESEEELADTLDAWLGNAAWRETGHRFIHLGIDGTGGQFAVWIRPDASRPYPVVVLGSEGGRGVLTHSPKAWAQLLAHGVEVDTYEEPACITTENTMLDETSSDPEEVAEAKQQLAAYRAATEEHLGVVPALQELATGLEELNESFGAWVDACVD